MLYEFKCPEHGKFEVEQNMQTTHIADCPKCGAIAYRVYSPTGHYYDNPKPLYHNDGSIEEF